MLTLTRWRPLATRSSTAPGEQHAVGGHRDLAHALGPPSIRPISAGRPGPHQRLAAGDADLADAQRARTGATSAHELVVAEELLAGQPLHALRRHAVAAAEVAPVGHREAQRPVRIRPKPCGPERGYAPPGRLIGPGRIGSSRQRLLHGPPRQNPGQVAAEVRRSPRCRSAGRCPRRPSAAACATASRGAPARAASVADARSGVWPMLASADPRALDRAVARPRPRRPRRPWPSRATAGGT